MLINHHSTCTGINEQANCYKLLCSGREMLELGLVSVVVIIFVASCEGAGIVVDVGRDKRGIADNEVTTVANGLRISKQDSVENDIIQVFGNCKCVYYYQCDDNNYVITGGETLIDVRLNSKKNITRTPCKGGSFPYEIICCKVNKTETETTSSSPLLKSPEDVIRVDQGTVSDRTKVPCGIQKTMINVRIFGDEDELTPVNGEFPWIVAVFKKASGGTYKFHCSGSLIHPKVVLTANHYMKGHKPSSFKVVVNGKIALTRPGSNPDEERNIAEIVKHPEYNSGSLFNDAALIILDEPFVATKENFINTLCLPPSDVNLEGVRCLVAGWGKDNEGESNQVMRKVQLPFVNHDRCQSLFRRTRLGQHFNLHKSFMCAGGERGKDACKGDGGSPLMCPLPSEPHRYFHMGIVSWGIGCGEQDIPGAYANVAELAEWIRNEMKERQLKI
ncbi:hypothetical protein NQ315_002142 [Exocentrus adspersus]|uniref:Uncharacterized protein n=1 Tax=Exocentrus adspersus TaxID=1586481 RepID=A0AAV8W047_9CUCU|nr:hypothetical protein NQ315_002142 [Exocentrus adspersus]